MFIGFFEYGDQLRYFGYRGQAEVTNLAESLTEARSALASMTGSTIDAAKAPFVQAFLRRKLEVDHTGKASVVDYYPETLIVEFRPKGDEIHPYLNFFTKDGRPEGRVPEFKAAISSAERIHRFATLHHRFPAND